MLTYGFPITIIGFALKVRGFTVGHLQCCLVYLPASSAVLTFIPFTFFLSFTRWLPLLPSSPGVPVRRAQAGALHFLR